MKKQILNLSLVVCLLLSGCSGINGYMESQMLEKSGIKDDGNYKAYQNYSENGKLTKQGYYSEKVFEADETVSTIAAEAAHVTFAENSYLKIAYFCGSDSTMPLNTGVCYLEPGNNIYATVSINKGVPSSMYYFSGFRIYRYEDGDRELIDTVQLGEDGFVLEISGEYAGAELSIEPIGNFDKRIISLRDYYIDDDGNEHELSGTWMINDRQETGNKIKINPVSSYIISYGFDSKEYFYLSSNPQCYYSNNGDGIVIFERRESVDETEDYSVELHKYVTVSIESQQGRNVSVNNGIQQQIKAGNMLEIPRLKYGDTVIIVTDKEWSSLDSCRELILQSLEKPQNGEYKYTLIVPQKGGEFVFDPSEYSYEHGTIIFKCFGEIATSKQYLAAGSKIAYELDTVDDVYWLADGDHVIVVGDEEETRRKLNNIKFVQRVKVAVELDQPEYGGRIRYFAEGKEITTNTFKTTSGTEIVMQFLPWEGWINHYKNGEIYTVTEDNSQTALIGNKDVDTAFAEDSNHKPALTVILDKSVGENMKFSFSASGLDESDYDYKNDWFRNNYTIIDELKIGTETGIILSMGSRAIQSGTAVKILVDKTDTNGKKTSYYRLVDDLTKLQDLILIYEADEQGTSDIWYKSVKITISVVDVLKFIAPTASKNATVTVRNATNLELLKTGDILEDSEKVTITITPNSGYYVSGKNVKKDIYQNTMKFSKYQSDIRTILDEHPIEMYYHITLDANDAYGVCTYKLDGEVVSGKIRFKAGQKLSLEYKITASGYMIEGAKGLPFGIGKKDREKTESITITENMDGKIINKDIFGINVVKGE
jgi:hypothetical protein